MRFGLVVVAGPSMAPGLRDGDVVLVRWGAKPRVGAVVVASFAEAPGVLVVKRVSKVGPEGIWLVGDNPAASDDSRTRGPVREVAGRVLIRWRSGAFRGRSG